MKNLVFDMFDKSKQYKLERPGFSTQLNAENKNFAMQSCHDSVFLVKCGMGSFDLHRLYEVQNLHPKKKLKLLIPQKKSRSHE